MMILKNNMLRKRDPVCKALYHLVLFFMTLWERKSHMATKKLGQ